LLDLLKESKLHPIFHISILKQHMSTTDPIEIALPAVPNSRVQPQVVLEQRMRKGELEILVHWEGFSLADASWEKRVDFTSRFLDFVLEDNDVFKGK
jgi:hypothetical protein